VPPAPVVIALLRAVNVGARRVAMSDLRRWCEEAGHRDVRTYVQSGNLVFRSGLPLADVAGDLEARLAQRCGFEVPVVVRTADAWGAAMARCPFDTSGDPTRLVVAFAPGPLGPDALGGLDPDADGAERLHVEGGEVYLWLPDGQGRSPLAQAFARTPAGKVATARNWRTVAQLASLAAEVAAS